MQKVSTAQRIATYVAVLQHNNELDALRDNIDNVDDIVIVDNLRYCAAQRNNDDAKTLLIAVKKFNKKQYWKFIEGIVAALQ